MPVSGGLYTAQHPLFSMFIGGLVAYRDQDREVIGDLFRNIISGTRGVSSSLLSFLHQSSINRGSLRSLHAPLLTELVQNVPPAWRGLQSIWGWIDSEQFDNEEYDEEQSLGSRTAWWEDVTAKLKLQEGRLNLA